jgi:hypothetical protein
MQKDEWEKSATHFFLLKGSISKLQDMPFEIRSKQSKSALHIGFT